MGETKTGDVPLPSLFEQARKIHSVASESSVDQETLKKGIEILSRCDEMVSKLGLFSSNETKEEVSTANLKYLLVPFYLGELSEKVLQDDRIRIIKISQDHLKEFISICEVLELVPEEEIESPMQVGNDFAAQRAKKIARFKRQRAAEVMLQEIKERKERRGRSLRAAALSTPIEAGEEDILDDDGEEEREAWLVTISLALCKALDLLDMLKKEEQLLLAVKEKKSQGMDSDLAREILDERTEKVELWHKNAASRAPFSKPAQPITCANFAQDVIEGRASVSQVHEHKHQQPLIFGPTSLVGGKLTSERERIAAQVFQPGYRLPTMSIEEAGLREMEMMQQWQDRNSKLLEEANSSWHKDNDRSAGDEDDDDAAVEKARAWDDWKDDNPRGAEHVLRHIQDILPAASSSIAV